MADLKAVEQEAPQEERASDKPSEGTEKTGQLTRLLIVLVALLSITILGLAGFITVELVVPNKSDKATFPTESGASDSSNEGKSTNDSASGDSTDAVQGDQSETKDEGTATAGTASGVGLTKKIYYEIKPDFVVNFQAGARGARFLQVQVVVVARYNRAIQIIENNLPLIKNNLIESFSGKRYDELASPTGQAILRRETRKIIQSIVDGEDPNVQIEEVLFQRYVMQ